jgi:hypothetical protein
MNQRLERWLLADDPQYGKFTPDLTGLSRSLFEREGEDILHSNPRAMPGAQAGAHLIA